VKCEAMAVAEQHDCVVVRPARRSMHERHGMRAAVLLVGALAVCAVVLSLREEPAAAARRSELLLPRRSPRSEAVRIKEEASEDNDRRENVALQAETLRTALRAMQTQASAAQRAQLAAADGMLRKGAEGGSAAGIAALQHAHAVLSEVVGEEAAQDRAAAARGATNPARTQSLVSNELSVPDERAAWRARYMDRYAGCWPHCAPEANIMNTIDSTKYPYNEEAGGHRWTAWKIGHSGINAAYAQAERKYYDEGRRVREAASADHVYPNTLGPAYKAAGGVASTALLGHAPIAHRDESRAAYDRRIDREWRRREREAHPYTPLQEGERGNFGRNARAHRQQEVRRGVERSRGQIERPRQQMMPESRAAQNPGYVWTGRGGQEETNVWSTDYLRQTSQRYYGEGSGRKWAWRDDSTDPSGYYYNVLAASPSAGSAPAGVSADASADAGGAENQETGDGSEAAAAAAAGGGASSAAETQAAAQRAAAQDIVFGGPPLSPAAAREAAYEIVSGGPRLVAQSNGDDNNNQNNNQTESSEGRADRRAKLQVPPRAYLRV
jgi:hypothetical protein